MTCAQAMRIGLLGADPESGTVRGYLATQGFAPGDLAYIDTRSVTPTFQDLMAFDAVLVWTDYDVKDRVILGDLLADYVDAGGRVVLCNYAATDGHMRLQGRIITADYSPIGQTGIARSSSTLVAYDASSPILSGVTSVTGYYRSIGTLNPGAHRVADWADGNCLAAWGHNGKVICIGLLPGETSSLGMGGDYARLYANALRFSLNPQVGLLGSDSETGYIRSYLVDQGFSRADITYINTMYNTPTAEQLNAFDTVLVWSSYQLQNSVALGDRLADYVDAGHHVVLADFVWYVPDSQATLKGRIAGGAYNPFAYVSTAYTNATLGAFDVTNPIMEGISSLGSSHRMQLNVAPNAQLVASWSDGKPLVAISENGKVVGINMYPGEYTHSDITGDYGLLFANAVRYIPPTSLRAYVTFADYAGDPAYANVKVELLQNGNVVNTKWAQGTPSQTAVDFPSLTPGTYDVRVSSCKWLKKTVSTTLPISQRTLLNVTLDNGDTNGDGRVSVFDLNILKKNWNRTESR